MTGSWWLDLLFGIAAGLLLAWAALIVALAIVRPRGGLAREALRLLPDVLGLLPRLAADRSLPRRGTSDGFAALCRIAGLPPDNTPPATGQSHDHQTDLPDSGNLT